MEHKKPAGVLPGSGLKKAVAGIQGLDEITGERAHDQ